MKNTLELLLECELQNQVELAKQIGICIRNQDFEKAKELKYQVILSKERQYDIEFKLENI